MNDIWNGKSAQFNSQNATIDLCEEIEAVSGIQNRHENQIEDLH